MEMMMMEVMLEVDDVVEDGFALSIGAQVLFRPYLGPKGVGGCEVESDYG